MIPLLTAAAVLAPQVDAAAHSLTVIGYHVSVSSASYISANVNLFPAGADDSVVQVSLPFPVYLFGVKHATAWVSSNGNIQFTSSPQATFSNNSLPSSSLSTAGGVAPYWDDLYFNGQVTGQGVYVKSASGKYIVSWRGVEYGTSNPVRAEVIFYQNSRTITFQYLQGTAASATIGLQKTPFGPATQWSYNTPSVSGGERLDFVPF